MLGYTDFRNKGRQMETSPNRHQEETECVCFSQTNSWSSMVVSIKYIPDACCYRNGEQLESCHFGKEKCLSTSFSWVSVSLPWNNQGIIQMAPVETISLWQSWFIELHGGNVTVTLFHNKSIEFRFHEETQQYTVNKALSSIANYIRFWISFLWCS